MKGRLQNLYLLCPSLGLGEGSAGFWPCALTILGLPSDDNEAELGSPNQMFHILFNI